jgi:putative copper resistance protein D
MLDAWLIVSRFLHYAATLTLFGISLFPIYTYPGSTGAALARVYRRLHATMWWAALAALLSAVLWLLGVSASMTGTLDGVLDPDAAWSVLSDTSFGKVWMARFTLAAVIVVLISAPVKSLTENLTEKLNWLVPALCGGLLVSLAGFGHTHVEDGMARVIHISADGLHLLAAGAWLGGLVPLFHLVARTVRTFSPDDEAEACNAAMRFSGMGYIAVATLIGSGLINSWFLVGSFGNLGTPYGELLVVKVILFAGMLGLATLNRFFLVPSLIKANETGEPTTDVLMRLRRHILGEQALGILVILMVSAIGTMEPPVNLSQG